MNRFWIRRGLRFLGFAILFVSLAGLIVMTLWNALLPPILGVSTISFWQALGLLVLSRILFGGYGFGRGSWRGGYGRRGWRYGGRASSSGRANPGRANPGRAEWKQKMAERWQQMTPEQREHMKVQWRNRCGGGWGRGRWGDSEPEQPAQDPPTTTAI